MNYKEAQEAELEVLQAIYGDDYTAGPSEKAGKTAWKAVNNLLEFRLRIRPLEVSLQGKVGVTLVITLPKTYPRIAVPLVQLQDCAGLSQGQIQSLNDALSAATKRLAGQEMLSELADLAAGIITEHHSIVQSDTQASLSDEMALRAEREQTEFQLQQAALAEQHARIETEEKARLSEQIESDKQRKRDAVKLEREIRAKERATLADDADEHEMELARRRIPLERFPHSLYLDEGTVDHAIVMRGARIECQLPYGECCRAQCLFGEGQLQAIRVHEFQISNPFLASYQGRRKLIKLVDAINQVAKVKSALISSTFGAALLQGRGALEAQAAPQRLLIITSDEQIPNLRQVLSAGSFPPQRALEVAVLLTQSLLGLHEAGVPHCAVNLDNVLLMPAQQLSLKLYGATWLAEVDDLNAANPFSRASSHAKSVARYPLPWCSPAAIHEPWHYDRPRDMWDLAIVFSQLFFGSEVMDVFGSPTELLRRPPAQLGDDLHGLLAALFRPESRQRPTVQQSLKVLQAVAMSPSKISTVVYAPLQQPLSTPSMRSPLKSPRKATDEDTGFFGSLTVPQAISSSRYQADFVEVEFLGRGGFGQVCKARNKIDGRFYAIKKIKLQSRDATAEQKILREVTIWSRVSHENLVRFHTSWIESETAASGEADSELGSSLQSDSNSRVHTNGTSASPSDDSDDEHSDLDSDGDLVDDDFEFSMANDLNEYAADANERDASSYPFVRFGPERSGAPSSNVTASATPTSLRASASIQDLSNGASSPTIKRTLYIQMELIEGATLREVIDSQGITVSESWRLLRQMLSAMEHFTAMNIIHRDLKPSNIFLTQRGDIKIGDLGLAVEQDATELLPDAAHEPQSLNAEIDLTSAVGTSLYIAPEMMAKTSAARPNGPRYNNRVDMYALGIVMFEIWYPMKTGMERIHIIKHLRTPEVVFPDDWPAYGDARQTRIIQWLLSHDPAARASPADLLKSDLLPSAIVDETLQEILRILSQSGSSNRQSVLNAVFQQPVQDRKRADYSFDAAPDRFRAFDSLVSATLRSIYERRGAIEYPIDQILPAHESYDKEHARLVRLIDEDGLVTSMPFDLVLPFCRKVARDPGFARFKSWTIAPIYRRNPAGGSPLSALASSFFIVSEQRTVASEAELIQAIDAILDVFPMQEGYEHLVNHTDILDIILRPFALSRRSVVRSALEAFRRTTRSWAKFSKEATEVHGLENKEIDTLALLDFASEPVNAAERILAACPSDRAEVEKACEELQAMARMASVLGLHRPIFVAPLLSLNERFVGPGIFFQTCLPNRKATLASGGRYDKITSELAAPDKSHILPHVVGAQIAVARLKEAIARDQELSTQTASDRGAWSRRRVDVYVVSFADGLLETRLSLVKELWARGIRADLMYDHDWQEIDVETVAATCRQEGVLYMVIAKQRSGSKDQILKVRDMRGGEEEVIRADLAEYIESKIAAESRTDPARRDASTISTASTQTDKLLPSASNFHLLLPADLESSGRDANRRRTKQKSLVFEKAQANIMQLVCTTDALSVFAIDVDGQAFRTMSEQTSWVVEDDAQAIKTICDLVPPNRKAYILSVRDRLKRFRADNPNSLFVWLYSIREYRAALLCLSSY
ncbi:uncharacterized protein L969DRAFT_48259 [Mixia osmundae IAM 14324]|uniref:non-specific serine/threonine protein kinase n=1 Tax=Mixia osmundae (strain CBS 9802 / IAM 14324 / JCM 22182 / KY 12970) TaxID=764103 RepID=G7E9D2_MIXOS|nr:uncharacterized protein L969DRAFT_48259 [Mixia osmundae IAM 14324]KEI39881.1 hypothetical protein L969DRAFT_48259 [Mixia osmundae IAM 14324]GAA99251.1 hypothetical protein E5Q_05945 [Mixia osmundae IAM 14324]